VKAAGDENVPVLDWVANEAPLLAHQIALSVKASQPISQQARRIIRHSVDKPTETKNAVQGTVLISHISGNLSSLTPFNLPEGSDQAQTANTRRFVHAATIYWEGSRYGFPGAPPPGVLLERMNIRRLHPYCSALCVATRAVFDPLHYCF